MTSSLAFLLPITFACLLIVALFIYLFTYNTRPKGLFSPTLLIERYKNNTGRGGPAAVIVEEEFVSTSRSKKTKRQTTVVKTEHSKKKKRKSHTRTKRRDIEQGLF